VKSIFESSERKLAKIVPSVKRYMQVLLESQVEGCLLSFQHEFNNVVNIYLTKVRFLETKCNKLRQLVVSKKKRAKRSLNSSQHTLQDLIQCQNMKVSLNQKLLKLKDLPHLGPTNKRLESVLLPAVCIPGTAIRRDEGMQAIDRMVDTGEKLYPLIQKLAKGLADLRNDTEDESVVHGRLRLVEFNLDKMIEQMKHWRLEIEATVISVRDKLIN
jgi:hypothetical protein